VTGRPPATQRAAEGTDAPWGTLHNKSQQLTSYSATEMPPLPVLDIAFSTSCLPSYCGGKRELAFNLLKH